MSFQPDDLFVSPPGNDAWSGRLAEPNDAGTDGPLATLAQARDLLRQRKERQAPATVWLRGGRYALTAPVCFGPQDSRVTFAAYPGETPVLSSAVAVTGWHRPAALPAGLPPAARDKVWAAPIPAALAGRQPYTLYDGMTRLPRARTAGFTPTAEAPSGVRDLLHFPPGAMKAWANLGDVELVVRPSYPWTLNILGLRAVDEAASIAYTTLPGTYPLNALSPEARTNVGPSCWVENVPEGLDTPGAWLADTASGMIYLWPTGDEPGDEIGAPCLTTLVRVEGDEDAGAFVRDLVFQGITFAQADREAWTADDAGLQHDWDLYEKDNALLRMSGVESCRVDGCRFTCSGGGGLRLDFHSQGNTVDRNACDDLGGTGILLCGYGPGTRDVNKGNRVTNNHVHHCGRIFWHASAIFVWQSGDNLVAHNHVHHMPYNGITVSGVRPGFFTSRDNRECSRTIRWDEVGAACAWDEILPFLHARGNVVEANDIHHVVEVLEDGNGIYISGAGEGNIIRRNYIHDLLQPGCQAALRTDDFQQGTHITENVIAHCVYGGIILKHVNVIENNIIYGLVERERVPLQAYIMLRSGPVKGAVLRRNILCQRGVTGLFYEESKWGIPPGVIADCTVDENMYAADAPQAAAETLQAMQAKGLDQHSLAADPCFVDPEHGDFRLHPDSPAHRVGFTPIDLSRVGIEQQPALSGEERLHR